MGKVEQVGEITEQDLLEQIVQESGHIAPPDNSFTVDDYIATAKAAGCTLTHNTALDTLLRKMDDGILDGRKMNVNGRQRWVFWPMNHTGTAASG